MSSSKVARLRGAARDPLKYVVLGLKEVADLLPRRLAHPVDSLLAIVNHRWRVGHWPRARRPRTFNEKLVRKRILDRRPYLTQTADKHAVRGFVADRIGEEHLATVYGVLDRAADLDLEVLPDAFVLKGTHGSGCVTLVHDKSEVDVDELRATGALWLTRRWPVWNRDVPPRLIIEELLRDESGGPAADYKYFVCNGRVQVIQYVDRFGERGEGLYDAEWNQLEATFKPPLGPSVPAPANLGRMLDIALSLAEGTDFVRVDLYDLGDRIVFGELTHTPHGGAGRFTPSSFDRWLGDRWDQPRSYRSGDLLQRI